MTDPGRDSGGTYARDPLSVLLDGGARRLLDRAYSARGSWVKTRLADPNPRVRTYAASLGIDASGPDRSSAQGGRSALTSARSRWARAFIRALYYQHRWYSPYRHEGRWRRRTSARDAGALQVEVGRHLLPAGIFPAGRAVRVRIRPGGRAKRRAVETMPEAERIWTDDGGQGGRFSDPELRDW